MKKIMISAVLSAIVMLPMMAQSTNGGQTSTTKTVVVDRSQIEKDTRNLKRSGKPAPRLTRAKHMKAKL